MKYLYSLFFLLFFGAITFAQTVESKEKTIALDQKNYHIDYPSNWDLDKSRAGIEFFLYSKLTDENDKFKENVNFIIQDLSGHNIPNLDAFVSLSETQIKTMIKEVKITTNERVKLENSEFHKMVYSGKAGTFNLTFLQYFFVQDNKAYILTFTSETAQYKKYKDIALQVFDSFNYQRIN